MRHAEISTTIRHYTDLGLADPARAVARIPKIVIPTLRITGTDGPLLATPNDRQHQCQQTVNETMRAATKGRDATRNSTEVVKLKSDQEIAGICDGLRTDAKEDEKAGEEDRTPDIQLGNGGQPCEFPEEKAILRNDPSTGPSTLCAGIDDFRQLQTMLGTWSLVSPNARLAFVGLLVRTLKKLPVSPDKSEVQPVAAQPIPTAPPPSQETGREDVQSIVVRRDGSSEITSSRPSSEIVVREADGADDDDEEEDEEKIVEEPKPTARSVLKRLNISFHPEKRRYYVRVFRHGKTHWAGYFDTPEVAADAAAKLRERLGLPFLPIWLRRPPKPE